MVEAAQRLNLTSRARLLLARLIYGGSVMPDNEPSEPTGYTDAPPATNYPQDDGDE